MPGTHAAREVVLEQIAQPFATLSDLLKALVLSPVAEDPPPSSGLSPGDQVGRFRLTRELGRGGHGVVFEARDSELGRLVALKVLRRGTQDGPDREAALLREAGAVASLHHPSIVTLYDLGRCACGPYLVLELLRGESLGRRLARGPLPVGVALRLAGEVAGALVHAHERGVLHRDVKPANVFLDDHGHAKVLDFGIARVFGHDGPGRSGTPGYMAPEQLDGRDEDERTDVYSLGLLLLEMLTGLRPQAGRGGPQGEAIRAQLAAAPAAVARLLEQALAHRPSDRPDAAAMQAGLSRLSREQRRRGSVGRAARRVGLLAAATFGWPLHQG